MKNHGGPFSLGHLSDHALLSGVAELTRSQHLLTAKLLAHLAEVDARKLYLSEACSSLFAYCRDRLGFSEDEAYRRVEAARIARQHPRVFDRLESGSISLSVLAKLKPHVSAENMTELLDALAGKSVRDAERILAARFPKPDVADSIRKLPERRPPASASAPAPAPASASAPAPMPDRGRVSPLSADRVQVKFTASRALEEKLALARDLMSHSNPSRDLATVIEAALDLLIADRKQKKFGETSRAQKKRRPAQESRVTNATRREVVARDGLRCSYVDASGRRCEERGFLELDHREVRAKGGSSDHENVRVLCRAHNQGEAERVFGKDHMERCR